MYRILMDDELVWSNETPDVGVYNAKITLEANNTNSMEVSVAHNYPAFRNAKMLQSIVEVYQDDETDPLFVGRPLSKQTDFQGNTIYKFEGVLGYLYDSIQPPVDYTGQTPRYILEHLIAEHNSQTEDYKHFVVGDVTIIDNTESNTYTGVGRLHDEDYDKDPAYKYQYDTNKTGTNQTDLTTGYESTFDAINNLLINNLSGNLVVRIQNGVMYLDYLERYLPTEGQVILFGSNLLDFSSTLDYSSICSGVLPLGYSRGSDDFDAGDPDAPDQPDNKFQEEDDPLQTVKSKLTIASVNGGSKILWDQGMIDTYGRIVKAVEWDNCKDANKLLEKARAYLYKKQYDNLTLECKIIDLHFVEGTYTPIHFMHMVQVKSEPHGLDKMMPVNKMDIDLMNPANDTVSLGQAYNSITGEMANTKDQVSKVTGQANNISSTIKNNNGTTWTNFSKTDKAITMEAHDRQTSVDDAKKELQTDYDAKFQITAQQISSEVSARTESENQMVSDYTAKINQQADRITSEVRARSSSESDIRDSVSNLQQTATGIQATVETKTSEGDVKSIFQQEAGSFKFSADQINFNGKSIDLKAGTISFTGTNATDDKDLGIIKYVDGKPYRVLSEASLNTSGSPLRVMAREIALDSMESGKNYGNFYTLYIGKEKDNPISGRIVFDNGCSIDEHSESGKIDGIIISGDMWCGAKRSQVATRAYVDEQISKKSSGYIKKSVVDSDYVKKSTYNALNKEYTDYKSNHSHTNSAYDALDKRRDALVKRINDIRSRANRYSDKKNGTTINKSFHDFIDSAV